MVFIRPKMVPLVLTHSAFFANFRASHSVVHRYGLVAVDPPAKSLTFWGV